MKKNIKEQIKQVKDELDKISLNSEVIENYNKLLYVKLDKLNNIDISDTNNNLLIQLYDLISFSECYLTLNYSISQELDKVNSSIKLIDNKLSNLLEACKNDTE